MARRCSPRIFTRIADHLRQPGQCSVVCIRDLLARGTSRNQRVFKEFSLEPNDIELRKSPWFLSWKCWGFADSYLGDFEFLFRSYDDSLLEQIHFSPFSGNRFVRTRALIRTRAWD